MMTAWQQWLQHPEKSRVRNAFFQIHLWVGAAVGVYVLLMSISGSMIVYRNELSRRFSIEWIVNDAVHSNFAPNHVLCRTPVPADIRWISYGPRTSWLPHAVCVSKRALEDMSQNFHVAMTVHPETAAWSHCASLLIRDFVLCSAIWCRPGGDSRVSGNRAVVFSK